MGTTKYDRKFRISEVFLDGFTQAILDKNVREVHIVKFGKFVKKPYAGRKMRLNLQGQDKEIVVAPFTKLAFKPSKTLKRELCR